MESMKDDDGGAAVHEALWQLDRKVSQEYKEALWLAPDLVDKESNYRYFLRMENGDVAKAATRLALYWKYRKILFGERWLLSMNQTGRGCLSNEDLEILHSGSIMFIVRPNRGPLFLFDRSKLPRTAGLSSTRITYYLASIYPEDFSHPEGISIVGVVTSAPFPELFLDKEQKSYAFEALPTRPRFVCFAQSYEFGKELLIDSLAHHQIRVFEYQTNRSPLRVAENSVQRTVHAMERLGISRNNIPIRLGGNLDDTAQFANWIRQRLSVEDIMSAAPPRLFTTSTLSISTVLRRIYNRDPGSFYGSHGDTALVAKTATAPTLPSRCQKRTYQRNNEKIIELREQADALGKRNARLRLQNRNLESMLSQARLLIAILQDADLLSTTQLPQSASNR